MQSFRRIQVTGKNFFFLFKWLVRSWKFLNFSQCRTLWVVTAFFCRNLVAPQKDKGIEPEKKCLLLRLTLMSGYLSCPFIFFPFSTPHFFNASMFLDSFLYWFQIPRAVSARRIFVIRRQGDLDWRRDAGKRALFHRLIDRIDPRSIQPLSAKMKVEELFCSGA